MKKDNTKISHVQSISKLKTGQALFTAMHTSAIGIDVHESKMVACYQYCNSGDSNIYTEHLETKTKFIDIKHLVDWICKKSPDVVVFESTGVYWMSLYDELERRGFSSDKVAVLNARDVKAVRGRKTDWADAARLTELGRSGCYKASFIPPKPIRQLRVMCRALYNIKKDIQKTKNRMHKYLTGVGFRASQVFSNVRGKAATAIIDAVIGGARGDALLEIIKKEGYRLKASTTEIYEALNGDRESAVWFLISQTKRHLSYLEKKYEELLNQIRIMAEPYKPTIDLLMSIPGVKEIGAITILSEIGDDLSSFKSIKCFTSWIGICPGNSESAGKKYSGRCTKGNKYLKRVLIEIANAVGLSRKGYLYQLFQTFKERRGHKRAIVAIAHKIARIIFACIKNNSKYKEIENCNVLKDHRIKKLKLVTASLGEVNLKIANNLEITNKETNQRELIIDSSPDLSIVEMDDLSFIT